MPNPSIPNEAPWTILTVLKWTADYFERHGIEGGRLDAEVLLASILASNRIDLYLHHDQPLTKDELFRFKGLIKQRAARVPVAYILGQKEFWSLMFTVSREVLIPRPETECMVEAILKIAQPADNTHSLKILELGTGSGAIVVALASEMPSHAYTATDHSVAAIKIAQQNAKRLLPKIAINWVVGNWLDAVKEDGTGFDIILSNPPYIPKNVIKDLQPEICRFEPNSALNGGSAGLDSFRRIIPAASRRLCPGGYLFLEIGHDQRDSVSKIARECGCYETIIFRKDYSGYDRIAILRLAHEY